MNYRLTKRALDVATSAIGLLVTSPVFVVVAGLVKAESEGPVFFRQARVGLGGNTFRIWKFRSMVVDAEQVGAQVTSGGDQRVTRVGRFLRRSKVDEIPQLINVFMGEMSLVGPRPEVRKYVELFTEEYAEVLTVPPGITDEASIEYRNEEGVLAAAKDPEAEYVNVVLPRKIVLYLDYVRNPSIIRDLSIILRTLLAVVVK